ncbi:unnamed protein product, partial [Brassica oleracea]
MATQKQIQTSSVSNEKLTIQDLRPRHTTKLVHDVKVNDTSKIAESILEETNNEDTEKVEHHEIRQQITRLGLFLLQIEENKLRMSKRWYTLRFRDSDIVFTKSESYIIDFQHRQQFIFISSFVD